MLDLPHGPAVVQLSPAAGATAGVTARLRLAELRDLGAAVTRCRRMLDLDADPAAVDDVLGADPALAPLVAAHPGAAYRPLRTPTSWRCGPCSASRYRWPAPARSPRGC